MDSLSERQIAQAEQHIAFEGTLQYMKWVETSAHGFKITLQLGSRHGLDSFDGVMTVRSKRGGQRYMAIIQPYWQPDGPGTPEKPDASQQFIDEWQFAGRGWSESAGAHIAVCLMDRAAIASWKLRKAADQITDDSGPRQYYVMLLELDDDETIVNQEKRERVVRAEDAPGGPRSKKVARLCDDPDFQEWLSGDSIYASLEVPLRYCGQPKLADKLIKRICGIDSKRHFDVGANADKNFETFENQFNRPFIKAMSRRQC